MTSVAAMGGLSSPPQKKYGARGVGVDIDPQRVKESNENARQAGVTDRVKFIQHDLFEMDFSEATVIALYLYHSGRIGAQIFARSAPQP